MKENFTVRDRETGREYWISRAMSTTGLVVVTDEPNGPQFRTSNVDDRGENEKEAGISTSCSSDKCGIVRTWTFENLNYVRKAYILVAKRGPGCPDYVGCWNIPCGYLNWDESLKEGCTREVYEETGVMVPPERWKLITVDDRFSGKYNPRQNVSVYFRAEYTMDEVRKLFREKLTPTGGEEGETEEVEFMELTADNITDRDWAFLHEGYLINELANLDAGIQQVYIG